MTDQTKIDLEGVIKTSLEELKGNVAKNIEDVMKMTRETQDQVKRAEDEAKKYGSEFGDTKSKVSELSSKLAEIVGGMEKQAAAIERLNQELKGAGGKKEPEASDIETKAARDFMAVRHYGEAADASTVDKFDEDSVTAEQVQAYTKAAKLFWSKVMRTPARVRMVEHELVHDEMKLLEPLIARKSISTVTHGNRFWLMPEMSDRIIRCYDETTDLSRLFSTMDISRSSVVMMKDNDVSKRALFRCELDCSPGRNPTPPLPGTVEIATHELHDSECITHQMMEDAEIDLMAWLIPRISEGFTRGRNETFLNGDGNGKPKGLMFPGNHIEVPMAALSWQFIRALPFMLPKRFQAKGSYMMARDMIQALFTMSDGVGRPIFDQFVRFGANGEMMLDGYLVHQIDQLSNYLTTAGAPPVASPNIGAKPLGFGAWQDAYLIVNRKGFFALRDPAYNACGVTWHFGQRVGGDVLCENASLFAKVV